MSKNITPQQSETLGEYQEFQELYHAHPQFRFDMSDDGLTAFMLHLQTKALNRQADAMERQAEALETLAKTVCLPLPENEGKHNPFMQVDATCSVTRVD